MSRSYTDSRQFGTCCSLLCEVGTLLLLTMDGSDSLASTHTSSGRPAARFEEGACEDTSRSGKGLRPLHLCFIGVDVGDSRLTTSESGHILQRVTSIVRYKEE